MPYYNLGPVCTLLLATGFCHRIASPKLGCKPWLVHHQNTCFHLHRRGESECRRLDLNSELRCLHVLTSGVLGSSEYENKSLPLLCQFSHCLCFRSFIDSRIATPPTEARRFCGVLGPPPPDPVSTERDSLLHLYEPDASVLLTPSRQDAGGDFFSQFSLRLLRLQKGRSLFFWAYSGALLGRAGRPTYQRRGPALSSLLRKEPNAMRVERRQRVCLFLCSPSDGCFLSAGSNCIHKQMSAGRACQIMTKD